MFSYDFQIAAGDKNTGTVYLPHEHSTNLPVIIYCHGWGGSRRLCAVAEKLLAQAAELNFALVAFDFFACGDTGGDYGLMTYGRWKNNLADIFSWCSNQSFADPNKIGCYSVSSGTTAALRFAAENSKVAFVISVATAISSHIGMNQGGPAKIFADHAGELLAGGKKELFGTMFGAEFFIDNISNAPVHGMGKIQCPVLFLQGQSDGVSRRTDAFMGYELMKQNKLPATYFEIPGGNHGLDNVADEAADHILNWLSAISLL